MYKFVGKTASGGRHYKALSTQELQHLLDEGHTAALHDELIEEGYNKKDIDYVLKFALKAKEMMKALEALKHTATKKAAQLKVGDIVVDRYLSPAHWLPIRSVDDHGARIVVRTAGRALVEYFDRDESVEVLR